MVEGQLCRQARYCGDAVVTVAAVVGAAVDVTTLPLPLPLPLPVPGKKTFPGNCWTGNC